MSETVDNARIRADFSKIKTAIPIPNLIEVQKSSYDLFLDSGDAGTPQDGEGLQGVFDIKHEMNGG